jgi:hypothetical protein
MKINRSLIAITIFNACLLSSQAQYAFQPSSAPPEEFDDPIGPVNLGMVFTPNTDITVNGLGFYDMNIPGIAPLTGSEQVGIYNSAGTLLAQTTVTTSDPLAGGYFWASISSLVLDAGQQYTVDAYNGGYGLGSDYGYGVLPDVNSQIAYDGHTYDYTGAGLTFPTDTAAEASDAYYGPNFSIGSAVSTVPDNGLTVLLLGVSLAGLACVRRKVC